MWECFSVGSGYLYIAVEITSSIATHDRTNKINRWIQVGRQSGHCFMSAVIYKESSKSIVIQNEY